MNSTNSATTNISNDAAPLFDMEPLDEITLLFNDNHVHNIEILCNEIAYENKINYDDLYVYTKSDIVLRSTVDEVLKKEPLRKILLEKVNEEFKDLIHKFYAFTQKEIYPQTRRETIAVRELVNTYGNDYWSWAVDAFAESTEYFGCDLEGFEEADIQTAVIQIIYNHWQ